MPKWRKVPAHRNPNYERVSVVRMYDDYLTQLPAVIGFAREYDAVLTVSPRPAEMRERLKPEYRLRDGWKDLRG